MNLVELAHAIRTRSLAASQPDITGLETVVATVVRGYSTKIKMESFAGEHFTIWDEQNRSVGFYPVETKAGHLWCHRPAFSDVLLLVSDEMVLGWVGTDQIVASEGEFTVPAQQLRKMPDTFDFCLPCPHLSVFGGWRISDESSWECYGCGELIAQVVT